MKLFNWAPYKKKSTLWQLFGLFAVYYLAGRLGLQISAVNKFAALIWPPTGIALAALLLFGPQLWPAIFVGAFLINFNLGAPAYVALGVACGNTLEALLGTYLCRRASDFRISLDRYTDVVRLVVGAAFFSTLTSATLGVVSLRMGGNITSAQFEMTWLQWWIGDLLGDLTVAPLVLVFATDFIEWKFYPRSWKRAVETLAFVVLLAVMTYVLFFHPQLIHADRFSKKYLLFPMLLWAALRFGQQGSVATTFYVSAAALWSLSMGRTPFGIGPFNFHLLHALLFISVLSISGLFLAGVVTQRDRERLLVKRSNAFSEGILRGSMDAIISIDSDGRIVEFNPSAERTTGIPRATVLGQKLSLVCSDLQRHFCELMEDFEKNPENPSDCRFEMTFRRQDGREFPAEITFVRINLSGSPIYTAYIRDVTERKLAEADLKQAKEAAEAANAAKSAFLANMSHEIRTPLGLVLGFSDLITKVGMSPQEQDSFSAAIKRNGKLLSNIINDILDLSKVEAGKLVIERIHVEFDEIVSDIMTLLKIEAEEKGLELNLTLADSLPENIHTDPLRLRQILLNVIGNAVKFTDEGQVNVRVETRSSQNSMALAFVIQDTGPGMSPEAASKLFLPFSQVNESATRRHGGTGLGLALSKKLAKLLGGDLTLESSAPGQGSTFVVTIDPCAALAEEESRRALVGGSRTMSIPPLRILVVDDSADNQVLVRRLLRDTNAHISTAYNGREAVSKALKNHFDVVLMDLQMPEMDGYEATKVLRSQGYKNPIIALTAHAMKEERKRCLAGGFNEHLSKPINQELLLKTIAEYAPRTN